MVPYDGDSDADLRGVQVLVQLMNLKEQFLTPFIGAISVTNEM